MTIIDPTTMSSTTRGPVGPMVPVCWDGTNIWSGSPSVSAGTPNLFAFDPDLYAVDGYGNSIGDFQNLNGPTAICSRVTPSGARLYVVCNDNTVQLVVAEPYIA
jgi:hypothetical protein